MLSITVKKPAAFRLSLEIPVNGTTTTLNAGHHQVKGTQVFIPLCVLADESDQWVLFQNGEAGLLGEAFSLLTSVQSCTKPKDVSLLLSSSFRSIASNCWTKVLPHLDCVTMTSSYSCMLCPCFSHASQNVTFLC